MYHCFACGVGGDAIDFTARLFGISQYEAAKKLIEDFRLDINIGSRREYRRKPSNKATLKPKKSKVVLIREKLEQWLKYVTGLYVIRALWKYLCYGFYAYYLRQ